VPNPEIFLEPKEYVLRRFFFMIRIGGCRRVCGGCVGGGVLFFVSLSMIFQASRFSVSGREVPLEPRDEPEACRSCQPMHVPSFGVGLFGCFLASIGSGLSCDSVMYFAPD